MKFVNDSDAASPFYVGKCKNNTPPKHVLITEGENAAEVKKITILSGVGKDQVKTAGTMYRSKKSAEYIYLKVGDKEDTVQWLWIKDATSFDQSTFSEVIKEEKPKAEKKAKADGAKTAEIKLEDDKSYSINGTIMTGKEAYKRYGTKNTAGSIAQGKVFEVDGDGNQVGRILGQTEEAAAAGDTGAA